LRVTDPNNPSGRVVFGAGLTGIAAGPRRVMTRLASDDVPLDPTRLLLQLLETAVAVSVAMGTLRLATVAEAFAEPVGPVEPLAVVVSTPVESRPGTVRPARLLERLYAGGAEADTDGVGASVRIGVTALTP
jgi:hypothetical protein